MQALAAVAAGVVTVVLVVFIARRYPNSPVWATGWIALAALSWRTSRRVALTGAAVMLVVLSVAAVLVGSDGLLLPVIFTGWAAAAVLGSDALRSRRGYLAGLRERALFLERTREEEARRRVAEERLRIARDLHDSVAHAMATINVQAGAARHVLARRPEAAGEALAVIQRASGDVLDELAAMLTVLRDDTRQADRAPVPGAADIARLAEATTASGLAVGAEREGPVEAVPGVIGTAAYRVVQESLTNVLRHSRAAAARVRLVSGPDGSVLLEIGDDGPAAPHATGGTGVGIRGMRERVASTGGKFEAGPGRGRRFPGPRGVGGPAVIRVVLADDQPLVRAGFAMILGAEDDITVVGEADDGAAAVALAASARPDVVLMDIRMPGIDGLSRHQADQPGRPALARVQILVLTTFELDEYVFEALRCGASGFLVKHTQPGDLVRAVREVARGEALLSPERHQAADRGIRGPAGQAGADPAVHGDAHRA